MQFDYGIILCTNENCAECMEKYIIINRDNPRQISLNIGIAKESKKSAIYKISVLKDNNINITTR